MRCYESCFSVALDGSPESLELAKTQSHDNVIASTGGTRRSGVQWSFWPTNDAVLQLAAQGIPLTGDVTELCRVFPHRTLVMATVVIEVAA